MSTAYQSLLAARPNQAVWVCARRTYAQPKRFTPDDFEHAATVASYSASLDEPVASAAAHDCGAFLHSKSTKQHMGAAARQPDAAAVAAAVAPRGGIGTGNAKGRIQTASRAAKWRQPVSSRDVSTVPPDEPQPRAPPPEACRPLSPEHTSRGVQTQELISSAVQTDEIPPIGNDGRSDGRSDDGRAPPKHGSGRGARGRGWQRDGPGGAPQQRSEQAK